MTDSLQINRNESVISLLKKGAVEVSSTLPTISITLQNNLKMFTLKQTNK